MFFKGEVIRYNDKDYVILDINYKSKKLHIGIPNKDNISVDKIWIKFRDLK